MGHEGDSLEDDALAAARRAAAALPELDKQAHAYARRYGRVSSIPYIALSYIEEAGRHGAWLEAQDWSHEHKDVGLHAEMLVALHDQAVELLRRMESFRLP